MPAIVIEREYGVECILDSFGGVRGKQQADPKIGSPRNTTVSTSTSTVPCTVLYFSDENEQRNKWHIILDL
jgi:hypothetical protein